MPSPGTARRIAMAGFTMLEFVVVLIVISVLIGVFFQRFLGLQEMVEKTAMEQTVVSLRSALNIQMAALITRGRMEEIPQLAEVNPMMFLATRQPNYAGEFDDPDAASIPRGSWYFDRGRKHLVYLVAGGANFSPDSRGNKRVRYQVSLVRKDQSIGRAEPSVTNEFWRVALREIEPYEWVVK